MHTLSTATLIWLIVPMSTVVVLALLSYLVNLVTKSGSEQ